MLVNSQLLHVPDYWYCISSSLWLDGWCHPKMLQPTVSTVLRHSFQQFHHSIFVCAGIHTNFFCSLPFSFKRLFELWLGKVDVLYWTWHIITLPCFQSGTCMHPWIFRPDKSFVQLWTDSKSGSSASCCCTLGVKGDGPAIMLSSMFANSPIYIPLQHCRL